MIGGKITPNTTWFLYYNVQKIRPYIGNVMLVRS